jgi:outer membrane usher protein
VTDKRGQLIVPNLSPFVANRLAIDPGALPVDAEVAVTTATVAPYSRVPVRVDFRVQTETRSAVVAFIDPDGHPLELGSEAVAEGQEEVFVVGYDGEAFLSNLRSRNIVIVTTPDRAVCRAQFDYRPIKGEQVRIDGVVCWPGS